MSKLNSKMEGTLKLKDRLPEWVKKHDLVICCVKETHFAYNII